MNTKRSERLLVALECAMILICAALFATVLGYSASDLKGHWRICATALRGIDPYPFIGQEAPVAEIGKIPQGFSTVPWSLLLGNITYAGFLPPAAAKVYVFVLHFVSAAFCALLIDKRYGKHLTRMQRTAVMLCIPAHFSFMYSLRFGNAGAILCCVLAAAICTSRDHPVFSGCCVALAMLKPQIAAIVCIVLLLDKSLKPLLIGAAIVIAGWAGACLMVGTGPVMLLKETLASGTASNLQYLGLTSMLTYAGVPKYAVLALNAVIGCLYAVIGYLYLKKRGVKDIPVLCFPACIASTFWTYKNGTDYLILFIAVIVLILLFLRCRMQPAERCLSVLAILYLLMSRCAVYLAITLGNENEVIRQAAKSADGLILAVIGIWMMFVCGKYAKTQEFLSVTE